MEGSPKKRKPNFPSAFAELLATQSDVAASIVIRSVKLPAACLLAETSPAARALFRKHRIFKKKNLNMSLQVCCARGYVECVKEILAYKELNPNLGVYYPLRVACASNQLEIAKLLLADARVTRVTKECLTDALQGVHFDIIDLLLDDTRTEIPDYFGMTPHEFVVRGALERPDLAERLRKRFPSESSKWIRIYSLRMGIAAEDVKKVVNFYFS